MTNSILAFDELDRTLGSFFEACREDLNEFLNHNKIENTQLASNRLNDLAIQFTLERFSHFVFGAYSHGTDDCLVRSASEVYISIPLNGARFRNSFFYTFSCSSGKSLGRSLIDSGCLCFIGYENEVSIWSTFVRPFVVCANYGLQQFFMGYRTNQVLEMMNHKYNEEIDNNYLENFVVASILRENRDALILHGQDISIQELPRYNN